MYGSNNLPPGCDQSQIDDPPARPDWRGEEIEDGTHDPEDAQAAMSYLIFASGDAMAVIQHWESRVGRCHRRWGWVALANHEGNLVEGPTRSTPYAAVSGWVEQIKKDAPGAKDGSREQISTECRGCSEIYEVDADKAVDAFYCPKCERRHAAVEQRKDSHVSA